MRFFLAGDDGRRYFIVDTLHDALKNNFRNVRCREKLMIGWIGLFDCRNKIETELFVPC